MHVDTAEVLLDLESLSPEQDTQLNTPIEDLRLSPHAQALVDCGLEHKAVRLTLCGSEYRFVKHGTCKAQRQNISRCGYRSCYGCAKCKAFQQYERFKLMGDMIQSHFTHMEFTHPFDLERADINIPFIHEVIAREFPDGTIDKTVWRGAKLVTKMLHVRPISNELRMRVTMLMASLGISVATAVRNKNEFQKVLESVTEMGLPESPAERALFELIFEGRHQLQTLVGSKNVNRASALTLLVPMPDPLDTNKAVMRRVPRCKQCGMPCTHYSQVFSAISTLDDFSRKRWRSYLTGRLEPNGT